MTLKLTFQPHLVDVTKAPKELQMELTELSVDDILNTLFDAKKDPIEIWKNFSRIPTPSATCPKNAFLLFNHLLLLIYILLPNPNQDALKVTNDGYPSRGSAEIADLHAATKYSDAFQSLKG
jgi:hypothetical protein